MARTRSTTACPADFTGVGIGAAAGCIGFRGTGTGTSHRATGAPVTGSAAGVSSGTARRIGQSICALGERRRARGGRIRVRRAADAAVSGAIAVTAGATGRSRGKGTGRPDIVGSSQSERRRCRAARSTIAIAAVTAARTTIGPARPLQIQRRCGVGGVVERKTGCDRAALTGRRGAQATGATCCGLCQAKCAAGRSSAAHRIGQNDVLSRRATGAIIALAAGAAGLPHCRVGGRSRRRGRRAADDAANATRIAGTTSDTTGTAGRGGGNTHRFRRRTGRRRCRGACRTTGHAVADRRAPHVTAGAASRVSIGRNGMSPGQADRRGRRSTRLGAATTAICISASPTRGGAGSRQVGCLDRVGRIVEGQT